MATAQEGYVFGLLGSGLSVTQRVVAIVEGTRGGGPTSLKSRAKVAQRSVCSVPEGICIIGVGFMDYESAV